jgi:hypothetical protein
VDPFRSEFVGATLEQLGTFVETTFGQTGRGSQGANYIWKDRFGVLDARTMEDNTLEFAVKESLMPIESAELRVAWGGATRHDEAMVRYDKRKATQEDLAILIQEMNELPGPSSDQQPLHLETEVSEEDIKKFATLFHRQNRGGNLWETSRDEWVRMRLNVAIAGQCAVGINSGGASYYLNVTRGLFR